MKNIIRAYLSGSWYPSAGKEIISDISKYESQIEPVTDENLKYLGGVVPHAGWFYSGKIACSVYYNLSLKDNKKDLIVLLGGHLATYSHSTVSAGDEYETPLGNIKISREASDYLLNNVDNLMKEEYKDYSSDNTIEVQLPFIKHYFKQAELLVVKPAPNKRVYEIGKVISELNDKYNLAIIGSTDLTHYGSRFGFTPHGTGRDALKWVKEVNDKEIVDFTLNMDYENILKSAEKNSNACCAGSLAALIIALNYIGLKKGRLLEYNTSYDINPDGGRPDNFVGYQGVIF